MRPFAARTRTGPYGPAPVVDAYMTDAEASETPTPLHAEGISNAVQALASQLDSAVQGATKS
eukprot:6367274-Karenia_brevis.AAC.1